MASTYTTNLGIEKIGTGEQSGTWGDTTNTNLDLIDEAVNGIISITLSSAGSSGSPTALPITDGSSSNGRNKFIEFVDGGDLGGTAYVQLTPNDAEKIVHIRNSLSSSRSVIVFQGTYNASNDFEIVNGADVLLKFNGGGSGATVTDVNVDLTVTGATIATADINGGAIDGTVIGGASAAAITATTITGTTITASTAAVPDASDGATLGSASLEWSDLYLADGAVVFFGDDQDITLTHVADTGLTLKHANTADDKFPTFLLATGDTDIAADDKLGVINFQAPDEGAGTDAILVAAGIEAVSEGDFSASSNATSLVFKTGASEAAAEKLRVTSAGRLGIGTNSPASLLEVSGASGSTSRIHVKSTSNGQTSFDGSGSGLLLTAANVNTTSKHLPAIQFGTTDSDLTTTNPKVGAAINAVTSQTYSSDSTGGMELVFYTTPNTPGTGQTTTERLRIANDGSVGIGTSSPGRLLDVENSGGAAFVSVVSSTSDTAGLLLGDTDTDHRGRVEYDNSSDALKLYTASSTRVTVNSSGNVGIGATTVNRKLELSGNNNGGAKANYLRITDTDTTATAANQQGGIEFFASDSSAGAGLTASIEVVYAGSGGGGEITFNTAANSGAGLTEAMRIDENKNFLVGTTASSNQSGAGFKLKPDGGGTNNQPRLQIVGDGAAGDLAYALYDTGDSALKFYVRYDGVIFATSTSISAISDQSLKDNIRDLDKGLEAINALKPRRFDWKDGSGKDIMGFVAQEVEDSFDELVHDYEYRDEETKLALKMGDMIPSMVKAIQELSAQVNELKAEVAALKGA